MLPFCYVDSLNRFMYSKKKKKLGFALLRLLFSPHFSVSFVIDGSNFWCDVFFFAGFLTIWWLNIMNFTTLLCKCLSVKELVTNVPVHESITGNVCFLPEHCFVCIIFFEFGTIGFSWKNSLRFYDFTIRVYFVFSVSCQKCVFNNLASNYQFITLLENFVIPQ